MSTKSRLFVSFSIGGVVIAVLAIAIMLSNSTQNISAQEILENAQTENTTVSAYKFTVQAWQTPQLAKDPDRYETNTSATIVFGEGMHVVMRRLDESEDNAYTEALYLDGKQYHRDSPGGEWEESTSGFDSSEMGTINSDKHFQIVNDLVDSTVVGKETLRGIEVNKITGKYDLEKKVRDIWGDPEGQDEDWQAGTRDPRRQMLAGTEAFTGWVGVNDGLIHAFEVSASYPAEGELLAFESWYRVDFTDFNQSLTLPSVE